MTLKISIHTRDSERWVTLKHGKVEGAGQHVKIDGSGNVVAGLGGKKLNLSKGAHQQPSQAQPPTQKQARAKKEQPFRMIAPPDHQSPGELQDYTRALKKQPMAHIERQIRNNTFETAAICDENGRALAVVTQGNKGSIDFQESHLPLMKDATLTHNHPGSASFSVTDLLLCSAGDLAEMRAVGNGVTYSVKRPVDGWPARSEINRVKEGYNQQLRAHFVPRISAGEISPEQASEEHAHLLIEKLSNFFGMSYTRTREHEHS